MVAFRFHLLVQHTSTIKLLCCAGTPLNADASVGLHGDGGCEPEETASAWLFCWVASCSGFSQSAPSKP